MKSKDLQNVVLSNRQSADHPRKIFRDLNGALSLDTIQIRIKVIQQTRSINLSKPPGRQRTACTKATIRKAKQRLARGKRGHAYKVIKEPAITDEQKANRKKFATWNFDIDGVYKSPNDRIWAVNCAEANNQRGVRKRRKFPTKVMVWLGACSQSLTPLVILDEGSVDHMVHIEKVLPVAKKFGAKMFGDGWTFQPDNASAHKHHLTQEWCRRHLPSFISKERWPVNSPDFNPLDYSIWNELVQAMDWRKVTTKLTLITELKPAVKKIRLEVVVQNVHSVL
ncbi:unnamed protein product [Didymodactylos carnosus]|uniref:Uncharacterized protein n=1 Tax=Didymodactylos carnosus TaxID=1234261 RepID=A0A814MBG8_9BILA|nr:unnamed protein product [Didymodactylos carnosus]CAF3841025.1 unnamed protein product [Didymodactylos carnosus]